MADTVSFKVYLKDQEEEVRRFVIDKDVSTSHDYLIEKLKTVFPQLKNLNKLFTMELPVMDVR